MKDDVRGQVRSDDSRRALLHREALPARSSGALYRGFRDQSPF